VDGAVALVGDGGRTAEVEQVARPIRAEEHAHSSRLIYCIIALI